MRGFNTQQLLSRRSATVMSTRYLNTLYKMYHLKHIHVVERLLLLFSYLRKERKQMDAAGVKQPIQATLLGRLSNTLL